MKRPNITLKITIVILATAGLAISLISLSSAVASASSGSQNGTKPTLQPPTPTPYCPESYLELHVDKPMVEVGEHFTLTIIYHYLGLPYTMIKLTPEGLAEFDPPIIEWPCKYDCDEFTLRAVATGWLEISAGATGERYCGGWLWGTAKSKTPAVVQIVPRRWRTYFPLVSR